MSYSDTSSANIWNRGSTIRTILVESPKNWTKDEILLFAELVNIKTKTGWKVKMIINGDIIITDPTVETKTMKEFIFLLRAKANIQDTEAIIRFFSKHSIES